MNTVAIVLLALEPLVMIGLLVFTSRQLMRMEQGLRQDLTEDLQQGLRVMTGEFRQLNAELRANHEAHVQLFGDRLITVEAKVDWVLSWLPWVQYWAALHQQQVAVQPGEQFPA